MLERSNIMQVNQIKGRIVVLLGYTVCMLVVGAWIFRAIQCQTVRVESRDVGIHVFLTAENPEFVKVLTLVEGTTVMDGVDPGQKKEFKACGHEIIVADVIDNQVSGGAIINVVP